MTDTPAVDGLLALRTTASIVSAYVASSALNTKDLPKLIAEVYRSLSAIGTEPVLEAEFKKPAVSVRKSITPAYLVCLDDGMRFKSLKRHLAGLGMTPEQYREKWRLPVDYPMVAPDYAAVRSGLAKSIGLGRQPR